jgi:Plasmid pRiA4b ORF-3-like protein
MHFEDEERYDKHQSYTDNIVVAQIFEPKKKMVFLFDYGDMWTFVLECLEIREPKPQENRFPYGYNAKGDAPVQYGDFEDDE